MARLMTDEKTATPSTSTTDVMGGDAETTHTAAAKTPSSSSRKLSFKVRPAAVRGNFRSTTTTTATKVTLSSSNVALIASKFNTIVIEDDKQGRVRLRQISGGSGGGGGHRKTSQPLRPDVKHLLQHRKQQQHPAKPDSVVKAAIQIFEQESRLVTTTTTSQATATLTSSDTPSSAVPSATKLTIKKSSVDNNNILVRPKLVLVRKQSSTRSSSSSSGVVKLEDKLLIKKPSSSTAHPVTVAKEKDINRPPFSSGNNNKSAKTSEHAQNENITINNDDKRTVNSNSVKEVQRKPSLKAKPLLKNGGNTKFVNNSNSSSTSSSNKSSKIGSVNQRIAKYNEVINSEPQNFNSINNKTSRNLVDFSKSSNNNVRSINQRVLINNLEKNIRVNKGSVEEVKKGRTEEGKVVTIINEGPVEIKSKEITKKRDENVKGVEKTDGKEPSEIKLIHINYEDTDLSDSDKKENLIPETTETKQKGDRPLSFVEQAKEKLSQLNKDVNGKPKLQPKPKINVVEKRTSSLYKDSVMIGEMKTLKVFQSAPDILQEEKEIELNSKKLSIPRDASILENVFENESNTNRSNSSRKNLPEKNDYIKPNSSFLWGSNNKLAITETPIIIDDNNEDKVTERKEKVIIKPRVNDECKVETNHVIDVADSFRLEMKEQIEKRFSGNVDNLFDANDVNIVDETKSRTSRRNRTLVDNPDVKRNASTLFDRSVSEPFKGASSDIINKLCNEIKGSDIAKRLSYHEEAVSSGGGSSEEYENEHYTSLHDSGEEGEDHQRRLNGVHTNGRLHDDQDGYEDVGDCYEENNYAVISEYDDNEDEENCNIYDDVINVRQQIEDHYESVNPVQSQQDSDSSCDQNNSLYGMRPSSRGSPSAPVYQMNGVCYQPTPHSETSDEWVDLDNSDDQNEQILVYCEKERSRTWNTSGGGWSQKVRRQWSRRATEDVNDDGSDGSIHPYELVEGTDDSTVYDDFDDSFDSDSSVENENGPKANHHKEEEKGRLPPPPQSDGMIGLMKQAGKRMRKHWSLSKSLRRISRISVSAVTTSLLVVSNDSGTTSSSSNSSDLNRRRWSSFKSKFKPSTAAQSTFYLNSSSSSEQSETSSAHLDNRVDVKVDTRRLSTASVMMRPTSPPPPPPPPPRVPLDHTGKRISAPVFPNYESNNNVDKTDTSNGYAEGQRQLSRSSNSFWYLDNTDSASEHGSSQGSDIQLRFPDEPLYQFYTANIAEMSRSELNDEDDSDGYEEIGSLASRPSAMQLITQHHRTLWCEVPQVQESGVLDQLTVAQRKLQEAKFEVMTSEASYFKSLTVLDKHFASCPLFHDENILSSQDRKVLFSNVSPVRRCSEKLLAALEKCWQESILMSGICEIVYEHVRANFNTYVKYCTNQIYLDKTLKNLRHNQNFCDVLAQLEADPQCQSLSLLSFLMLPMQRVTRLPLLFDAILSRLDSSDPEFNMCQLALATVNKCVADCNESARRQERYEEMLKLSHQLEFSREVRLVPILSPARWLVRSGQLTQVNMDAKLTFSRRLVKTGPKVALFLFNDILVLTKKRSEDTYLVVDHCPRSLVQMTEMKEVIANNRYLIMLTMLENHESKTIEMVLGCDSETARQRWLQAVSTPTSSNPDETLYEEWDCPQVLANHTYAASQPDELSLQLGDVVNVLRKMADGWYFGERIRDRETGWFPGNHTTEIASPHLRARNLKQRYRLLALSGNYLQQQEQMRKQKS